jgi:hypothetical protein
VGRDGASSLVIEVGNNALTIAHQVHPYEENRFTVESTLSGFWLTHDNTYDEGYFYDDPTYPEEVTSHSAVANRAASHPMDMGWFPLDLRGTWEVKAGDVTCDANLTDTNGSLDCGPEPVRFAGLELSGTLAFSKASNLASKFGGLGGEWRASAKGGQCDISVAEDIRISCPASNGRAATTLTLTVSEDTVSGTGSDGVEFSLLAACEWLRKLPPPGGVLSVLLVKLC